MKIDVIIEERRWRGLKSTAREAATKTLMKLRKNGNVTILLADDATVRRLNKQYRHKDKPTNVLSFPDGTKIGHTPQLGDIILAYETIAREAGEQGKTLKAHLTHLTIHGVLHLLGYDHESEIDAEAMEAIEITILARMGIANPYEWS